METCRICNKAIKSTTGLCHHIKRAHGVSPKDYYDQFLKGPNEGTCPTCNKETKFLGLANGYQKHCSRTCSTKNPQLITVREKKRQETCLHRFGCKNPLSHKDVRKKADITLMRRFGSDNPSKSPIIKDKIRRTFVKKYGTTHPMKVQTVKDKLTSTMRRKFGASNAMKVTGLKNKLKESVIQKYGVENVSQLESAKVKAKQTWLKKLGVDNPMRSEKIKNKLREQNLKKFLPKLQLYLNYLELELVDEEYLGAHHSHTWRCKKCNTAFNQKWDYIQQGLLCPACYPKPRLEVES